MDRSAKQAPCNNRCHRLVRGIVCVARVPEWASRIQCEDELSWMCLTRSWSQQQSFHTRMLKIRSSKNGLQFPLETCCRKHTLLVLGGGLFPFPQGIFRMHIPLDTSMLVLTVKLCSTHRVSLQNSTKSAGSTDMTRQTSKQS